MAVLEMTYRFAAPRAALWDQLFDYDAPPPSFMKDMRVEIREPGSPDPKGLGCVRALHSGKGAPTVEEIVEWNPPMSFAYSIMESPMPVRSYRGRMVLEEDGDETVAYYRAEYEPKIRGTAWAVKLMMRVMNLLFLNRYFGWLAEEARRRPTATEAPSPIEAR